METTLVQQFAERFRGYSKAYGSYEVGAANDVGKRGGKARTIKGFLSLDFVRRHLAGTGPGWGSIPLLDDDTMVFGAIDIDDRTVDHSELARTVAALKLPLIVCRSKSGGAHLYMFASEPVPALLARTRLQEWAAMLSLANTTEIFPKQTTRYNDTDLGNWINLPYYGGDETERYALSRDGSQRLSLEEFLGAAYAVSVTINDLESYTPTETLKSELFEEGPPCLQMLEARGGFVQGTKKLGMFDVAIYLQQVFPDDWEQQIDKYNETMAQLTREEVNEIVKSVRKKKYGYQCKQPPINAVCQKAACRTRKYGVGRGDDTNVEIESIVRYSAEGGDDPYWILQLNGQRVRLTTEQLYTPDGFNKACMAQANCIPVIGVSTPKWRKYISELLQRADVVMIPAEATPSGIIWEYIQSFCTRQVQALAPEEVLEGKVWKHEGKVFFRGRDLFAYLDAKRVLYRSQQLVWDVLHQHGIERQFRTFNSKGVNLWVIEESQIDPEVDPGADGIPLEASA